MNHAVVLCARGWLGTRFHHQGRVKKSKTHKGGVDCLGLLAGVASEMKLLSKGGDLLSLSDEQNYSHQPDVLRLRSMLSQLLTPVAMSDIAEGDIVLLNIDGNPQHLAIVTHMADSLGIIHAYAPARGVVEHCLDGWWRERVEAVFRVHN